MALIGDTHVVVTSLEHDSELFAGRRNDLVITFLCEYCGETPTHVRTSRLLIVQHKGRTLVEWLSTDLLPRPGATAS